MYSDFVDKYVQGGRQVGGWYMIPPKEFEAIDSIQSMVASCPSSLGIGFTLRGDPAMKGRLKPNMSLVFATI